MTVLFFLALFFLCSSIFSNSFFPFLYIYIFFTHSISLFVLLLYFQSQSLMRCSLLPFFHGVYFVGRQMLLGSTEDFGVCFCWYQRIISELFAMLNKFTSPKSVSFSIIILHPDWLNVARNLKPSKSRQILIYFLKTNIKSLAHNLCRHWSD